MTQYSQEKFNAAIQHQKWLLSERARHDVGTPAAVDALILRWQRVAGKGFNPAEAFLSKIDTLPSRDELIAGYLFAEDQEPVFLEGKTTRTRLQGELTRHNLNNLSSRKYTTDAATLVKDYADAHTIGPQLYQRILLEAQRQIF